MTHKEESQDLNPVTPGPTLSPKSWSSPLSDSSSLTVKSFGNVVRKHLSTIDGDPYRDPQLVSMLQKEVT